MFTIKGKIQFDPINVTKKHNKQASWKKTVIVKFNDDMSEYYAWFLKKRFNLIVNKPLRGSHFTIINDVVDSEIYEQAREMFDGKEISIDYNPEIIRSNEKGHWWVKALSQDAGNIRIAMGLDKPFFGHHITIGRATHLNLVHSKYITEICLKYNQ